MRRLAMSPGTGTNSVVKVMVDEVGGIEVRKPIVLGYILIVRENGYQK